MSKRAFAAIIVAALSLPAIADDSSKRAFPPTNFEICPEGQALTWTVQCDPGSRPPVDRIWMPAGAGIEICRVRETRCEPIPDLNKAARPGFEVEDSPGAGSMAVVGFGLGRVLGAEP